MSYTARSPLRSAIATASVRLSAPSFVRMEVTWNFYHLLHQLGDRSGADRALKMPGRAGRRDAEDAAAQVDERSTGKAGIQREIHHERVAGRRQTATANVQRADDAGTGPGSRAESQDEVSDADVVIRGDVGDRHTIDLGAEHGDIEAGITPSHVSR